MTIDFSCQQCDADFELEITDVLEGEPLVCPSCGQKAPRKSVEELGSALDELMKRVAEMRPRFLLSMAVESDDLPPPYDDDNVEEDEDDDGDLEDDEEDDYDDDDDDDDDGDEDDDLI